MPDLYQNVIFRIGSQMGPGGLASLKAGSDMILGLTTKLIEAISSLDKFAAMARNVDMSLISMAQAASGGQIASNDLMASLSAMTELGLKPTAEEFKNIAKGAAVYADKTGKEAVDVFGQLTNSIIRASDRGLKPFGIDLKSTGTLLERMKDALEQFNKKFGDQTFIADSLSDKVLELINNYKLAIGIMYEQQTRGDEFGVFTILGFVLDELNSDILNYTENLQRSGKAFQKWAIAHDQVIQRINSGQSYGNLLSEGGDNDPVYNQFLINRLNSGLVPIDYDSYLEQQGITDARYKAVIAYQANQQANQIKNNEDWVTSEAARRARARAREEEENAQSFAPDEWDMYQSVEGVANVDTKFYNPEENPYGDKSGGGGSKKYDPHVGIDVLPEVRIWAKANGMPYETYDERDDANKAYLKDRIEKRKEYEDAVDSANRTFTERRQAQIEQQISSNAAAQEKLDRLEIARAKKESATISSISGTKFKGDLRAYYDDVTSQAKQALKAGTIGQSAYSNLIDQSPSRVGEQIAMMEEIEAAKENAYNNWLERVGYERLWQLEQIQFANDWHTVWKNSLESVTAGTMAAQAAHDLLRGTWNATIDAAITGKGNFSHAVKSMIADIGMAVAKEAGWQAVLNAAYAIAAAAKRDYGAALKYTGAAVAFGALAGTAAVAARALQPSSSSATTTQVDKSSNTSEYGNTYPRGGMSQQGAQTMNVNVFLDGEQIYNNQQKVNSSRSRSGQTYYQAA